jgi:hypothetical protein
VTESPRAMARSKADFALKAGVPVPRRFWMFQVDSKEEAIEWVKRCPDPVPGGEYEIEIRQVFEASDFETITPELREQEERQSDGRVPTRFLVRQDVG